MATRVAPRAAGYMPTTREEFLQCFGMAIPQRRRGTGRVLPTEFVPPPGSLSTNTPGKLFIGRPGPIIDYMERFTYQHDSTKILIYTDGACINNGQDDAKAAWAFHFGPEPDARTCSGRLENKGPFGDVCAQTSSRAELRAALAALRAREWSGDGYRTVVIASDSEYLVKGASEWMRKWTDNNWKRSGGGDVANRDLWEMLLGEAERYQENGLAIEFWRIERDMNKITDGAAKKAALMTDQESFDDFMVPGI